MSSAGAPALAATAAGLDMLSRCCRRARSPAPLPAAMNPRTRVLIEAPIVADAAAPRRAQRARHAGAGLGRADRDLFRRPARHRGAGRRVAGLSRRHADADDVGGRHGRRHLLRDRPRARRRPARRRRRAGAPCARHRARVRARLHGRGAGGRPRLYGAMGGSGAALEAALTYSNVVFAGAMLLWIYNSLANVIRGTGNMAVPAIVTCAGVCRAGPAVACLIFGWGPLPRLGVAGGARRGACVLRRRQPRPRRLSAFADGASCGCRGAAPGCAGRCSTTSCASARSRHSSRSGPT